MHSEQSHALAEIIAGQGTIAAVSFRQGMIKISLSAEEEVTLQVAHPYGSRWRARAWPQGWSLEAIPCEEDMLTLVAPPGTQMIEITQSTTPAQRWGRVIGLAAVVLLAGAALGLRYGKGLATRRGV